MPRLFLFLAIALAAAARLYSQNIDMAEARAEEDFRWAVRAYHNGFYGDAILSLEKSLGFKPQRTLTRLWLGNALFKAGFVDAALREWRFVLEQEPGHAELNARVQGLSYRRGLGRELEPPSPFVVAHEIDGRLPEVYDLARPSAVHIRPDGSVLVVAFAGGEVVHMNINSGVRRLIKGGVGGFDRPFDCLEVTDAASGQPLLFVSEYGANRIVRTRLDGEELGRFGETGSGPGQLLGPQYLAADEQGYLYVSDWGNARVSKFDWAGNFVLSMGQGAVLGSPSGVAVEGGHVYVADQGKGRIAVFDQSGNFVRAIGEGRLVKPEGLVFRDPDTLFVSDDTRIERYRVSAETWETVSDLRAEAGRLTHLAFSPNRELYATDFDRNRIFILSEMSALYSNLSVEIDRVDASRFPEITVEVSAAGRDGTPLVGLQGRNFVLTEGYAPVGNPRLVRANTDTAPLEVVLLVERSIAMKGFERDLAQAAEALHRELAQQGGLQLISAGERPRVVAPFGSTRLQVATAVRQPDWTPRWRLDLGLRMAASELVPRPHRKAVVYVATGALDQDAFSDYSLVEVADYLKNNAIPLYVLCFGQEPAAELEFLCRESGGALYFYYAPAGLNPLFSGMRDYVGPRYTLRYLSRSDAMFGKNYIELRAEVILHRKSGRAAIGYYAPLSD
ncbi:MAG: hypothetical protein JW820_00115 [Spirochaetales bacterium]|nr:hypothetical protein [Spirochaetales bacterium]